MQALSVVIVCKNEAHIIGNTLQSLQGLTDDIIVYDNGSSDDTVAIAKKFPVKLYEGKWVGFGKTKNAAIALARYDWILNIDADEAIDEELKRSLFELSLGNDDVVYKINFKNFFGDKWLKYGEWGSDRHIRFFNRKKVNWDEAQIHEELVYSRKTQIEKLKGNILHFTAPDLEKYKLKLAKYAELNAIKYFEKGKKAGSLKKYASAFFSFIQNYIFRAGFLDGKAGYQCALLMAGYTYKKYSKLNELNKGPGNEK